MISTSLQQNITDHIVLPAQPAALLNGVFTNHHYAEVDSNIAAWLPSDVPATDAITINSFQLTEALNNQELIEAVGGLEHIRETHLFSPSQIHALVEQSADTDEILQRNGYQNLFFVANHETDDIFLLGVVFDSSLKKWVPYIYRLRNLYRAWSRGNRVFLKRE